MQHRQGFRLHLGGAAGWLDPFPAAAGSPCLAQCLQFPTQGTPHVAAIHRGEELHLRRQAGAERGGAIAVEQPRRINQPAGPADARLAGVGLEPDVKAKAIGLIHHGQAIVRLVALQWNDPPAGSLVGRGATAQKQQSRQGGDREPLREPRQGQRTGPGPILPEPARCASPTEGFMVPPMQVPPFDLTEQLHQHGEALEDAVLQVLRSGQYIGGPTIARFEQQFAAAIGCPHAIGCNSGTDSLVLALRGLGIGPGDEVITSAFSFFATAEAISAVGATPVFVDVEEGSFLIDLERIEAAITPATRALMPVHLFGRPVDMERLSAVAAAHNLRVIEDCAQATGASWAGRPLGSWGDAGCFSFFPTKNLGGAGDGGAVTCRDPELAQRIRELAVHGMPRRYLHTSLGYNSRLDAIQAAVLNVKLPHLQDWIGRRRRLAATYRLELEGTPGLELPDPGPAGHSWNQFVVRVPRCPEGQASCGGLCLPSAESVAHGLPESCCRDWLKQELAAAGVQTIIYYPIPIHRQPAYAKLGYGPGSLPITERLTAEVLSLPIFPELSPAQQDRVVEVVRQVCAVAAPAKSRSVSVAA